MFSSPPSCSFYQSMHSHPFTFISSRGSTIYGTILSVAALDHDHDPASTAPSLSRRHALLLCHGMLQSQSSLFYSALSHSLLSPPSHKTQLDAIIRIDFSGHGGQSAGEFLYGGYEQCCEEVEGCIRYVKEKHDIDVTHISGHSLGANVALLYAAKMAERVQDLISTAASAAPSTSSATASSTTLATSPSSSSLRYVIALSPRYDMSIDNRFSKAELINLIRDGEMFWTIPARYVKDENGVVKMMKPERKYRITLESYRDRLRTDMSLVRYLRQSNISTLLIHGTQDEVIPLKDAFAMQQMIVSGTNLKFESNVDAKNELQLAAAMDPIARKTVCHLKDTALESISTSSPNAAVPSITPSSFVPSLTAQPTTDTTAASSSSSSSSSSPASSHIFVPLQQANHNYSDPASLEAMTQTILLWIEACNALHPEATDKKVATAHL